MNKLLNRCTWMYGASTFVVGLNKCSLQAWTSAACIMRRSFLTHHMPHHMPLTSLPFMTCYPFIIIRPLITRPPLIASHPLITSHPSIMIHPFITNHPIHSAQATHWSQVLHSSPEVHFISRSQLAKKISCVLQPKIQWPMINMIIVRV